MWLLFYFIFFWNKINRQFIAHQKILSLYPPLFKKKKKSFKKKLTKKFELSRHTTRRVSLSKNIKTIPICCFLLFYAHHLDYNFHFFKFVFWVSTNLSCVVLCISPPPLPPHSVLLLLPLLLPGWSVNTPTVSPSFGQRCSCSVIGMRLPLISRRIFISRN